MIVRLKIYGENVTINDGDVICENKALKEIVDGVLDLQSQPTQQGYYPTLSEYIDDLELISIEGEEDVVY